MKASISKLSNLSNCQGTVWFTPQIVVVLFLQKPRLVKQDQNCIMLLDVQPQDERANEGVRGPQMDVAKVRRGHQRMAYSL